MARRSYRPGQIIKKLREAKVFFRQGSTVGEGTRKIEVTEQTHYRWRREYAGMSTDEVKQPKEPESGRVIIRAGHREPCLNQKFANSLYNGI